MKIIKTEILAVVLLALVNGPIIFAGDLKDVKGPVDFPHNKFLVYLLIFSVLAIIVFAVFYFLRKSPGISPGDVKAETPWEKAVNALNKLQAEGLLNQGRFDLFFTKLSDILRRYIEEQFEIKAPEMTTEEFLYFVRDKNKLSVAHTEVLKDFLTSCDLVKFAQYAPTAQEAEKSFLIAKRFVDETKPVAVTEERE